MVEINNQIIHTCADRPNLLFFFNNGCATGSGLGAAGEGGVCNDWRALTEEGDRRWVREKGEGGAREGSARGEEGGGGRGYMGLTTATQAVEPDKESACEREKRGG